MRGDKHGRLHEAGFHLTKHSIYALAVLFNKAQDLQGTHDPPVPRVVLLADVVDRDVAWKWSRAANFNAIIPDRDVDGGTLETVVTVRKRVQDRFTKHWHRVFAQDLPVLPNHGLVAAGVLFDERQCFSQEIGNRSF